MPCTFPCGRESKVEEREIRGPKHEQPPWAPSSLDPCPSCISCIVCCRDHSESLDTKHQLAFEEKSQILLRNIVKSVPPPRCYKWCSISNVWPSLTLSGLLHESEVELWSFSSSSRGLQGSLNHTNCHLHDRLSDCERCAYDPPCLAQLVDSFNDACCLYCLR